MPTISDQIINVYDHVWDDNTMSWVPYEQPGSVAGGGDASAAKQDIGNTSLASIDTKLTAPLSVTGTFYQATQPVSIAAPVSVTGTFYQITQPVSIASMPSTPVTNANLDVALSTLATAARQDTGNTSLSTIAGKDFATSAKQDTGNTSLSTIAAKDFATSAKQDTGNTSLSTIAAKDFATTAKQDTGNTSLSSIDGKITAVNTGAVVVSSSALPTLAATSTAQTTAQTSLDILTDTANRRIDEANYLQNLIASNRAMLSGESANSQRIGFELR